MVRGLWVITMNWVWSLNSESRRTYRPTLLSSRGASTSSSRQKGLGRARKIENSSDTATRVRSPEESRWIRCVLFDRRGVHGPDGVDRGLETLVLLPQPLDVAGRVGRVAQQLLHGFAPLHFHSLRQPAFTAVDLGPLELQVVLLLSQGVQRAAHLFEGRFRPGEFRLRLRDLPLGLLGRGAELGLGEPPVLQGVRSEEHTSELQSPCNLVCRLLLEK